MQTLFAFLGVIGVLVCIHEYGHYLAAKGCGVRVLRFSFGFGPVLWQRRLGRDQTEWAISLFPLGGYVKMLDEREGEVAVSERHRAFNQQSVAKRSLIVAAGPLANFLLAIALYWWVFVAGSYELRPMLGEPPLDSPAAQAALADGELVQRLDGQEVRTWNELHWFLLNAAVDRDQVVLEVRNPLGGVDERILTLHSVRAEGWEGDAFERLGLRIYRPRLSAKIGRVLPDGVAEHAGLQAGDLVLAINRQSITYWHEFVQAVRAAPAQAVVVTIRRHDREFTVDLIPEAFSEHGQTLGRIGVAVAEPSGGIPDLRVWVNYPLWTALRMAIGETLDKARFSLVMTGKMLIGEASWKNISGPVTIADYAGQSARLGFDYYCKFMALVSISLGVLNLLPLPVLDGGHLMYHLIEVVRRRPLSERALQKGQQIGLALLLTLMAFAFFNDLNRLFSG